MIPFCFLIWTVVVNLITLVNAIRPLFGHERSAVIHVWEESGRLSINTVQLIFFFYPPLWGVRVVEAMLEMMED